MIRLEPNTPCRPQHNNGGKKKKKKSRQTFSAITGTRKPISHQFSGCKKTETAQANLAM
jgi:hypothetical protein